MLLREKMLGCFRMLAGWGTFLVVMAAAPCVSMAQVVVEGELRRGDDTRDEDQYADTFEIEAEGGERAVIILSSENFDTFLQLTTPAGEVIENDDAFGTGTSIIRTLLSEPGTYEVTATSYGSDETGVYELVIMTEDAESEATVTEGRLTGKGPREFTIEGEAGQRVSLTLTSEDFDTLVRLLGSDGLIAENDDASGANAGTNSQLETVLPASGEYQVEVDSFAGMEEGAFELSIEIGAPADLTEQGELADGDDTLESGELCDTFTIEAEAGQLLEVLVRSTEFDPYVIIETPSGEQWENDDLDGTDAGLIRILDEAGEYQVTVTSYTTGELGGYSMTADLMGSGGNQQGGRPPKP